MWTGCHVYGIVYTMTFVVCLYSKIIQPHSFSHLLRPAILLFIRLLSSARSYRDVERVRGIWYKARMAGEYGTYQMDVGKKKQPLLYGQGARHRGLVQCR